MKKAMACMCAVAILAGVLCVGGLSASAAGKLGDINGDNMIDMRDAFALYVMTSGSGTLTQEQAAVADVNRDGQLDMRDAFMLYFVASGGGELDDPFYTDPTPGDNVQDDDWGE